MNPGGDVRLKVEGVCKSFETADSVVEVLKGVNFELAAGESLAIVGPSGSGKSTLLHLLGTLDQPTGGTILIGGRDPFQLAEPELARFRSHTIGFVFQAHHLLPQYSVLENVLVPTLALDRVDGGKRDRARELLKRVGLSHRIDHQPAALSGGERQRVAVARALINNPSLLLCDEPTGNLDRDTAESVADLLFELHEQQSTTLILVTHSLDLASRCGRRMELREGQCFEV